MAEAQQDLTTEPFSQRGLIDQLDWPDGGGFSVRDATVAVHSLRVDWIAEAVRFARQNYLQAQTEAFSRQGLIDQLDSPDGGRFSVHDATVAVDSLTVNWKAQAVKSAKEYLQNEAFSCAGLIQQLDSRAGGLFTVAQATYAAHRVGDC